MNESRGNVETNRQPFLAGRQTEPETDARLAGATVADCDDVLPTGHRQSRDTGFENLASRIVLLSSFMCHELHVVELESIVVAGSRLSSIDVNAARVFARFS